MLKTKSILIILVLSVSCIRQDPKITVYNNSGITYDSISVSTIGGQSTVFRNVEGKSRSKGIIDFANTLGNDGCYTIEIYKNDSIIRRKNFGYYTNGASLNYSFKVNIESDTIIVSEK